jgi:hypothetical protein
MSQRFSLVLGEIQSAVPSRHAQTRRVFHTVPIPPNASSGPELRGSGAMTHRGPLFGQSGLEEFTEHGAVSITPVQHQHHVVALDVPAIPKRTGVRSCLLCILCVWVWITPFTILAVSFWRPEFALTLRDSRRIDNFKKAVALPRIAHNNSYCVLSVLTTAGTPTRLQLTVALASILAPSVDEDHITITKLSTGLFRVEVARCTDAVYYTLKVSSCIDSWNAQLEAHYDASVALSTDV